MTVIVSEQDIDFCVDAIKLIKDNNATFIKKDTSTINDKCIDIYKNMDDEVVIKIKEIDLIKADSPQYCYEEQPYEGSPLELKHKSERAKESLKVWWVKPSHNPITKEDFEKYMRDSKDYYDNRVPMTERKLYQLWKDGAEIGYNKAANEWNFIKEGKFPAENTECLCIIRPKKDKDEHFGCKDFRAVLFYRNKKFYLEEKHDNDSSLIYADSDFSKLVVAWKEIILPKEKDY